MFCLDTLRTMAVGLPCFYVLFRHFENLAVGLLAQCYSQDEKRAGLMLVREMELFGTIHAILISYNKIYKKVIIFL